MVNDSYDYEGSKNTWRPSAAKFRRSTTVAWHRRPSGEFKGRIDAVVREVGCKSGNNNNNEDSEKEVEETVQGLLEEGAGKVCAKKKYQGHHEEGYQSQHQHHGHRRGQHHHQQQYVGKVIKGPDSLAPSHGTSSITPEISHTEDGAPFRDGKRRDPTKSAKKASIVDHDSRAPS